MSRLCHSAFLVILRFPLVILRPPWAYGPPTPMKMAHFHERPPWAYSPPAPMKMAHFHGSPPWAYRPPTPKKMAHFHERPPWAYGPPTPMKMAHFHESEAKDQVQAASPQLILRFAFHDRLVV